MSSLDFVLSMWMFMRESRKLGTKKYHTFFEKGRILTYVTSEDTFVLYDLAALTDTRHVPGKVDHRGPGLRPGRGTGFLWLPGLPDPYGRIGLKGQNGEGPSLTYQAGEGGAVNLWSLDLAESF